MINLKDPSLFDEGFEFEILPNFKPLDIKLNHFLRSPLFYVGDKFKLMPQLKKLFPAKINTYIEAFCGGGSSFLNTQAKVYLLNDKDKNLIALHQFLTRQAHQSEAFFKRLFDLIESYELSLSFKNFLPPLSLRKAFKKTYFAKFNKENYLRLRADFNADKKDFHRLYLLLIYGFNHMLRFNLKNDFNLPVGNVDFNANVFKALKDYFTFVEDRNLSFFNLDFEVFLRNISFQKDDFIYLDPPYLISNSEYNKLWDEKFELRLYTLLKELDKDGVKWGLSNILTHKGKTNELLKEFAKDFKSFNIKSNYISFNDNSIKQNSLEIYLTNLD